AEPPAFVVALDHVWPSERADDSVVETARAAAEALGIENGPTYTQLRLGPAGPRVVELAARLGGGHDAELCRAALGVDLNGVAIAAALGEPLRRQQLAPKARVGGACVKFLVAPAGRLLGVDGLEHAFAAQGGAGIRIYRR